MVKKRWSTMGCPHLKKKLKKKPSSKIKTDDIKYKNSFFLYFKFATQISTTDEPFLLSFL